MWCPALPQPKRASSCTCQAKALRGGGRGSFCHSGSFAGHESAPTSAVGPSASSLQSRSDAVVQAAQWTSPAPWGPVPAWPRLRNSSHHTTAFAWQLCVSFVSAYLAHSSSLARPNPSSAPCVDGQVDTSLLGLLLCPLLVRVCRGYG